MMEKGKAEDVTTIDYFIKKALDLEEGQTMKLDQFLKVGEDGLPSRSTSTERRGTVRKTGSMSYRNSFVENIKTFRSRERAEFEDAIDRE